MAATHTCTGEECHDHNGLNGPARPNGPPGPLHALHGTGVMYQNEPLVPVYYIQAPAPPLSCQWPMPLTCSPYYAYPTMGFGMVAPPMPPNMFMDIPRFIVPAAQVHLMDRRRLMHLQPLSNSPHLTQRFQQPSAPPRVLISSEVQTESPPVAVNAQCLAKHSGGGEHVPSDSGQGTACSSSATSSPRTGTCVCLEQSDASSERNAHQSDQFGAEGCGKLMPINLPTGQCNSEQEADVCHNGEVDEEQQDLSQPEILASSKSSDKAVVPPDTHSSVADLTMSDSMEDDAEETESLFLDVKAGYKIVKLPFDVNHLKERWELRWRRSLEESVWSVESLEPFVPSTEWMIQQGLLTPEEYEESAGIAADSAKLQLNPDESLTQKMPVKIRNSRRSSASMECITYVPSTSRLADLGNVYYGSKLASLWDCGCVHRTPLKVSSDRLTESCSESLQRFPLARNHCIQKAEVNSSSEIFNCAGSPLTDLADVRAGGSGKGLNKPDIFTCPQFADCCLKGHVVQMRSCKAGSDGGNLMRNKCSST